MPAAPIVHRVAQVPLIRLPRGAAFDLRVVMDTEIDLGEHTAAFRIRARYGADRPIFLAPEAAITHTGQTLTVALATDAADATEDSTLTLADLQAEALNAWRLDFRDDNDALALRLQGDLEWLPEEGAWDDEPRSVATIPEITVTIAAGGAVTVTVAVITGGATVDNASVNAAIGQNAAASRTALGLGSAATQASSDFAAAGHTHDQLHDAATVSGNGIAISGQQISLSIGTGATQVAAGNHSHTPADIGAATAAQGTLAASAVQPNTTPTFGGITVGISNGGVVFGSGSAGYKWIWHPGNFFYLTRADDTPILSASNTLFTVAHSTLHLGNQTDTGLSRVSSGLYEVNNGTVNQPRDFRVRDLIATQYLRPASYTVAAANALSSPPDGAIIYVSNETGGAIPAYRRGSSWLRFGDNAAIS